MYKTILVGFDDSKFSKAALMEVANWVKRHGGRVIIVHAVYSSEEEFGIASSQLDKRLELGKNVCYQVKETVSSEFGIDVESLVCEGEPHEVIADIAHSKEADLIAMGTYGRRGLSRLIMGSVTSGVIVNSPCDVLVIKEPCGKCIGGSILLPYDGSEFSKKAMKQACRLSKIDDAEITVLYVIPRYEEMIGFFKTDSIKKSLLNEARKIIDGAKELSSGQGVSIKTEIEEGQAAEKIIATANKLKNNLIVMGSYGWMGVDKAIMGSTTERVIINASCPILVVR